MNSLVREHFTTDGVPKVAFETRNEAFEFTIKQGRNQIPYKCPTCKKYHLAKRTSTRQRNRGK